MSIFNQLNNEFTGEFYQTEPISSTPHRIRNKGTVLCLAMPDYP